MHEQVLYENRPADYISTPVAGHARGSKQLLREQIPSLPIQARISCVLFPAKIHSGTLNAAHHETAYHSLQDKTRRKGNATSAHERVMWEREFHPNTGHRHKVPQWRVISLPHLDLSRGKVCWPRPPCLTSHVKSRETRENISVFLTPSQRNRTWDKALANVCTSVAP